MPLTFDLTAVKDFDTLTDDEKVTKESLIFSTMAIGMNTITADNAREFFVRLSFWEKVVGAYRLNSSGEPVFFTSDDVLRFVGLRTNASILTPAKFYKHVWETHNRFNVPRGI